MPLRYSIIETEGGRSKAAETRQLSEIRLSEARKLEHYSSEKEKYHQIDRSLLLAGIQINFSLFVQNAYTISMLVEADEQSPATVDEGILEAQGDFVIRTDDIPLYQSYLAALLVGARASPQVESRLKAVILREDAKLVMKELLDDPRSGDALKRSKQVVNTMVDRILESSEAVYPMLSMKNYDSYTYTHSVNVAVLSIGLGSALGLERESIERLGIGALLHDIGKSTVPREILNKQGKLISQEYQIIKTHVLEGADILGRSKEIDEQSLEVVLQHHERLTGRGYPYGLKGDDIKLFGRITAIVDSYDALTTMRPYRGALSPFEALHILVNEKYENDQMILKRLILMLSFDEDKRTTAP